MTQLQVPANFLEIDVKNPKTTEVQGKRYTEYELHMRVSRRPINYLNQYHQQ